MLRLLLLFLLPLASAANANPVRVQTGEHDTFTRVVLTIPSGADWQLNRDEQGYIVSLPTSDGYDIDGFFELIPQDRIFEVSQNDTKGELRLGVDCDCYADAFLDQPNILVVDIRDGTPAADSPFEVVQVGASSGLPKSPPLQPVPRFEVQRDPLIPLIVSPDAPKPRPVIEAEQDVPVLATPDAEAGDLPLSSAEAPAVSVDLNELESSVVESLGRALSQGLLEPELEGGLSDRRAGDLVDVAAPGIRALTGVDRAAVPEDPPDILTQDGGSCLPDRWFDVGTWGDERPYTTQIGEARAKLTSATDRIDENAVLELARKYIFFGFGREAEQTLQLDGVRSIERNYLIAMARVIDGDSFDQSLFSQQASCASPVALWAFLASGPDAVDVQIDQPTVLRTFMSLPEALKQHLAPMLSDRFVDIGENDAAVQIMKVIRSIPDATLAAELAQVGLLRSLGEEETAVEKVVEIVATDVRTTPEVMIARLDDAIQNERPLTEDDFLLADSLRFENAQTSAATNIATAQIRAYLHLNNFAAAEHLIREETGRIDDEILIELENEYARGAVEAMKADAFLGYVFDPLSTNLTPATENEIAARLLMLGFPERAKEVVAGRAENDDANERSYLRAKAALALNDPSAVLVALDGRQSEQANKLRRIALEIAQSDGLVAEAYADEAPRSLWRRGDFSALIDSGDPLLQAASNTALDREVVALDPDKPLTSSRNLLNQSAQSREIMDELLARFSVSDGT